MRVDDVSKSGVYRARALECRKLAEMATPGTGAQYERLAIAYEQLVPLHRGFDWLIFSVILGWAGLLGQRAVRCFGGRPADAGLGRFVRG